VVLKMDEKKKEKRPHNIIMENRRKLSISGVNDIQSFDEDNVILHTNFGSLTIKGSDFHLDALSVDSGEMNMEGNVFSIIYSQKADKNDESLFSRLFK